MLKGNFSWLILHGTVKCHKKSTKEPSAAGSAEVQLVALHGTAKLQDYSMLYVPT